jgi:glycosyltransferase involved in cell wall biosynthesis
MVKELVTIIIPVFNREDVVAETLDSLLAQTYQNWECIVVDDHSTDSTWQRIMQYQDVDDRINAYQRPKERLPGGNACRNYGAELSRGDLLIFLDSDDLLLHTCIEDRVRATLKYPDFDMWVFQCQVFRDQPGDGSELWNVLHKAHTTDLQRFIDQDMPWCVSSPMWKKEFFLTIGKFSENIKVWQDWEMHVRAICGNGRIYKSDENHIDCFYRKSNIKTITSSYKSIEYKNEIKKFIYDLYQDNEQIKIHYRRSYVNLVMRSIYTPFLKGYHKEELHNARQYMMRIRLIGSIQSALLATLDAIFTLGFGKLPQVNRLLSWGAKIITDDYLVFRTKSTHLRMKHPHSYKNTHAMNL